MYPKCADCNAENARLYEVMVLLDPPTGPLLVQEAAPLQFDRRLVCERCAVQKYALPVDAIKPIPKGNSNDQG